MIDIQESFLAFLIFIGMQHQSEFRDKTFIFKPKLSFLMKNRKNYNKDEFPDLFSNSPYIGYI